MLISSQISNQLFLFNFLEIIRCLQKLRPSLVLNLQHVVVHFLCQCFQIRKTGNPDVTFLNVGTSKKCSLILFISKLQIQQWQSHFNWISPIHLVFSVISIFFDFPPYAYASFSKTSIGWSSKKRSWQEAESKLRTPWSPGERFTSRPRRPTSWCYFEMWQAVHELANNMASASRKASKNLGGYCIACSWICSRLLNHLS